MTVNNRMKWIGKDKEEFQKRKEVFRKLNAY